VGEGGTHHQRDDGGGRIGHIGGMEFITAPLEPLVWVLSPAGMVAALSLFGLVLSGIAGRILPNLEVSGSGPRSSRARRPLEAGRQRERIMQ